MDDAFLNGIARPRIEAEIAARDSAAQTDAAEDLLESLRAEVAAAQG